MKVFILASLFILPFANGGYILQKKKMTWQNAQKECEKMGGNLATIPTLSDNSLLIKMLKASGLKEAWIGYNDIKREGSFKWMTRDYLRFKNWGFGEPNDWNAKEDCTGINIHGLWNDMECSLQKPSFCQRPGYILQKKEMTWQNAQRACEKLGGNLATISSTRVNNLLITELKASGLKEAWIGYNDIKKEGTFKWMITDSYGFTNWSPGEPNDWKDNEDCTEIVVGVRKKYGDQNYNGLWNDADCSFRKPSFCQGSVFAAGYILQKTKMSWKSAQKACESVGGNLATITSMSINDKLIKELKASGLKEAWIGYNDIIKEGSFEWMTPDSNGFTNWSPGEPNDWKANEDCTEIVAGVRNEFGDQKYNGLWNDAGCSFKKPSFCQGTADVCKDQEEGYCTVKKQHGWCEESAYFMRHLCRKSCHYC